MSQNLPHFFQIAREVFPAAAWLPSPRSSQQISLVFHVQSSSPPYHKQNKNAFSAPILVSISASPFSGLPDPPLPASKIPPSPLSPLHPTAWSQTCGSQSEVPAPTALAPPGKWLEV